MCLFTWSSWKTEVGLEMGDVTSLPPLLELPRLFFFFDRSTRAYKESAAAESFVFLCKLGVRANPLMPKRPVVALLGPANWIEEVSVLIDRGSES